jgi:hypothetical protein
MESARGLNLDKARRPMIAKLLCMMNRHRPTRGAIHWEGTRYIASCKRCSEKIVRHKGSPWRKV